MSIIVFNNVSFTYPQSAKKALDGVSFSAIKGEFLAIMGGTDSGKTAFCKLINGVIPLLSGGKLSGSVTIDGICTDKSSVPQLALKVGMVMDDPDTQIFTSSVREEVAFGPENLLLPRDEIEARIEYALAAVGLKGFEDRKPGTLSGGEKQRLVIAAALAMRGNILVLDEPLCRLDPGGALEVMSVLKDIQKKHNITIIMVSHDSALMAQYADRVCILKNGKIAALDTTDKILSDAQLLSDNEIQPVKKINDNFSSFDDSRGSLPVNSIINISNLKFIYDSGSVIINNINLTVYENDFIAIIGDNGCGKTTLLKCITGLLKSCAGDIFINGRNAEELSVSDISIDIGYVMQNPDTQLFTDSVFKETAFALKNMRLSKSEIKLRVDEALRMVDLRDADAFPHTLSRTDRTKTVIACVIAMGCKTIILDEVDAGNDYSGNVKIMNLLRSLWEKGFTVIFVTHNMHLAGEYAHRLIKLDRNGIVYDRRRIEGNEKDN